jgi:hypothetical protein
VASGDLFDAELGKSVGMATITLNGQSVTLKLKLRDPNSGETIELPEVLYASGEPPPVDQTHDPELVGRWRYTWATAGGGASIAVDSWLIFESDGRCQAGKSKAAGGDANVGIETSGGDGFIGKWRTSDRIVYLVPEDQTNGSPLGRYYVEGNKMLLTYNNGDKRIYYRR